MANSYSTPDLVASVSPKAERDLMRAYQQLERWLRAQLRKLRKDESGLVLRNAQNIQAVRRLTEELERRAGRLFKEATASQLDAVRKLADKVLAEAGAAGIPDQFTATSEAQINALLGGIKRQAVGFNVGVATQLDEALTRSLTGNLAMDDLTQAIERKLQLRQDQALVMVNTSLSTFHRQARLEHFEEQAQLEGREQWYEYDGPHDGRNRDFCANFVGTRVTLSILRKYAGAFKRKPDLVPVEVWLGGYRCRHELIPLPWFDQESWEDIPIGPRHIGMAA